MIDSFVGNSLDFSFFLFVASSFESSSKNTELISVCFFDFSPGAWILSIKLAKLNIEQVLFPEIRATRNQEGSQPW